MFNFIRGVKVFIAFYLVILFLLIFFVGITVPRANYSDSIIDQSEFINQKTLNLDNQVNLNIKQQTMTKQTQYKEKKLIFVGDIMLDRGVEYLMNKNGNNYSFEQVKPWFDQADLVVANLEGPIVKDPPYNGSTSLSFAFKPETVDVLNYANIRMVSLANNHVLNMGKNGYEQTKNFLQKGEIEYIGQPSKCKYDDFGFYDDLIFIGFNKTYSQCTDNDVVKIITRAQKDYPDKLIVASIHWGQEYKLINSEAQQSLAHQMIDAGVDLIIGHHPHVVQNIEYYKNKLIFYSLGNFVFDQYFSKNTQEALAVSLKVKEGNLEYMLHPVQSSFSQPYLMSKENSAIFLANLAKRSSSVLINQIETGVINLNK